MRGSKRNGTKDSPIRVQRKFQLLRYHIQQIENRYGEKVEGLRNELEFLKEKADSQAMMLGDAVEYSAGLEEKVEELRKRVEQLESKE